MASSARIDELRKKFDENPRRYFAPLANEYRKAGDLDQAIFICQEYLPQQPGHMSGHIVYAQTLFEMGRHDEAKAVFETALSLDPENLIALRHLGDIARQGGDSNGARVWYQRVLEADPRNEEIAQIMISLLAEPATPPARPTPTTTLEMPALTPGTTAAVPADQPPASWAMDQTDSGGLDIEKSVDKTQLEGSTPPATAAQQPAVAAPDEPEGGHEWLDLNDLTIGGVAMGSSQVEDAEKPDSLASHRGHEGARRGASIPFSDAFADAFAEPFAQSLDEPESTIESFDGSTGVVAPDDGGFDLGREDGPFEEDPFAIAAKPNVVPENPVANVSEAADETRADDAPADVHDQETPAAVDGLEQFESGFMPPPPPTAPLETAFFFEAPPTPADAPALSEAPAETSAEAPIETAVEMPIEAVAETAASEAVEAHDEQTDIEQRAADTPVAESEFVESAFVESAAVDTTPAEPTLDIAHAEGEPEPAPVEEAFVTETMAELYLRQGHLDSAMDIYRKLVEQRPTDLALRERLHAVEAQMFDQHHEQPHMDVVESTESTLDWASESEPSTPTYAGPTIREFLLGLTGGVGSRHAAPDDAPVRVDADEMAEATEATEVANVVAAADVVEPPVVAEPAEEPVVKSATRPNAYLAPPTPIFNTAMSAPMRAAAPNSGETVGGSIDALFSDADASAADTSAATTLAEAFAPDSRTPTPLHGVPAHRATNELSLDHVFKSNLTPRSDVDTEGFSFDQFFADDMTESAPNATGETGAPSTEATDDIAQFNAWLNGLKKT